MESCLSFPLTNSKPSVSGFEFEEEKSDGKGVNQPERKLGMIYGICHSTSTKVKLIRAQGECLGIRSR